MAEFVRTDKYGCTKCKYSSTRDGYLKVDGALVQIIDSQTDTVLVVVNLLPGEAIFQP